MARGAGGTPSGNHIRRITANMQPKWVSIFFQGCFHALPFPVFVHKDGQLPQIFDSFYIFGLRTAFLET